MQRVKWAFFDGRTSGCIMENAFQKNAADINGAAALELL